MNRTKTSAGAVLIEPGRFVVGCNYWASHAGTCMWSDWRPDVVKRDLHALQREGLQVLRVFPLWPDFQPLTLLKSDGGRPSEYRFGETPLPDDPCGRAGMSAVMLGRFRVFLDIAAQHHFGCIVGLLTGWMSGRLFVPPALEGLNVLTDPQALRWEVRFVRHFVRTFKDHPAVLAWDLGNECNCMGTASQDQAYAWTSLITQTIRAADPTRPVVSGMGGHSPEGSWSSFDMGELTDLLTTHPYPVFSPYCDQDPVNTIRPILHSTVASRFSADISGRPCLCEEIGTLGPMIANETITADFARACLFSLWANDCHGLLWWCAFDQSHLEPAPYDWCAIERELGLLHADGRAKPVIRQIGAFGRLLGKLPMGALPPRTREAVCILTEGQDHWSVALSAFILAKQAGFDMEFQHASQPLRPAPFYLLPCLSGHRMIPRRRLLEVLDAVRAGAALYVSLDSGLPSEFEALTGLEPQTRERGRVPGDIAFEGIEGLRAIPNRGTFRGVYRATRATVLGREPDGNPAFSVAPYGKGRVFFLAIPLETTLTQIPGAFQADGAPACWRLYRHMAAFALRRRAARKTHPMTGHTEHRLDASARMEIVVNYSPQRVEDELALSAGWRLTEVFYGRAAMHGRRIRLDLGANDACVLTIRRNR